MLSDTAVRDLLERMVPLQGAYTDNLDRLNEIKADARSDGLNIEAINALLPILVRHPYDKGASVLNEVIRYAEAYGTKSLVSHADASSHPPPDSVSNADVARLASAEVHAPAVWEPGSKASAPLRLSVQVVAAMSVSVGLLWLLN